MNCPREYQSKAVDTLFEILNSLQQPQEGEDERNPELAPFGLYCTNHLLLPTLQLWLRRSQRTFQVCSSVFENYSNLTVPDNTGMAEFRSQLQALRRPHDRVRDGLGQRQLLRRQLRAQLHAGHEAAAAHPDRVHHGAGGEHRPAGLLMLSVSVTSKLISFMLACHLFAKLFSLHADQTYSYICTIGSHSSSRILRNRSS